jgi:two-component system, HptB-dependent secretion and biofilm response regulator
VPHRSHILVAEDDPVMAHGIMRYLSDDYDVHVVGDGREALEHLFAHGADLLLCDMYMPELNALQVIRSVRANPSSAAVPILLMSGALDFQVVGESLVAGADDCIAKPFLRQAVLNKIDALLESDRLRRRAANQQRELGELHARRTREAAAARSVLDHLVQRGTFPPELIRHVIAPADTFAGDLVCGTTTVDGSYRWMLADVTGHTLSSALVTIPIAMLFYGLARERPLAEAVAYLEVELARTLPIQMFCAATICELDAPREVLRVWNGGMPDVLVQHGAQATWLPSCAPPLATDRTSTRTHVIAEIAIARGSVIYTLSDGLTEAEAIDGTMLGPAAIAELARDGAPAFDRIIERWREHATGDRRDDVSLVQVTP